MKSSADIYIDHLSYIINLSFTQGCFPEELKIARVIPLYKSGDNQLLKNYRPVSVLPLFSKLFERVMFNRILEFINKHSLLYKFQFGLRSGHSTSNALMIIVDKILGGFNEGDMTIGVFIDFSKAFDTVNHQILLNKLIKYGIRGPAYKWLTNYLHNRKQFVSYDSVTSSTGNISCGVPQGSILGPLLFILFINDMYKVSEKIYPILFADDSNIFIQGKNLSNITAILNEELSKINLWIQANKLSLNIDKTKFILFKPRRKQPTTVYPVMINNRTIERIYETKFLGVIISSDLSWDHHTKYIAGKIAKGIGVICKARQSLSQKSLLTLYYSFVYPYLCYCVEVWGATSNKNLHRLHKMQKKIVCLITSSFFNCHTDPLFLLLKLLNVYKLYTYRVALFMYRVNKGTCPSSMKFMFSRNSHHNYVTRQDSNYCLPLFRYKICQTNIRYRGAIIWNRISNSVDVYCSYHGFKNRVKLYLLYRDLPI